MIRVYLERNGQIIFNKIIDANFVDGVIKYESDGVNIFDINGMVLRREGISWCMELDFSRQCGFYMCSGVSIPIELDVLSVRSTNGSFFVRYEQDILGDKSVCVYSIGDGFSEK